MSPESLIDPIAQLAVLATFDPNRPPADAMAVGLLESNSIEVESDHSHQAFMLSESARIEALAEVLRRGGRSGLGQVRAGIEPHYPSPLQRMLDAFVLEGDIPLAERTEDELAASLHVDRWSTAALARAALSGERVRPSREEIERRIRILDVERPIHELLKSGFIGRHEELARLKAYLGPPRKEGSPGLHDNPALLVHGVGGMGKSALIARLVKDLIEANERPKPIWAYLDFDRPTLQPQPVAPDLPQSALRARLVLQDLVRQFGAQRTDLRSLLEYDFAFAQQSIKADGLESFAGEDYLSGAYNLAVTLRRVVDGAPIVIVLDTFEEVERRGSTDAQQLYQLFDKLASALPTFRLVVSGRTPAMYFRTSLENELSVSELTEDDAREVLQHFILAEGGEGVVRPDSAKIVWEIVGRSPLSLRLAARAVADESLDALTDVVRRAHTLGRIRTEFIRGFLYHRIIDHLRAPNPRLRDPLKAVARAGLVLRQITRLAIEHVLLPVVGRDPSLAGPLFEALSRESALVQRLNANTLGVREELRGPALSALKLDDAGLVRRLHEKAAAFYAGGSVGADPVEAVFHYLAAGEGLGAMSPLGIELTGDILYSLERSYAELPRGAVDFVEAFLRGGVLDAEGEQIAWERKVASVVDTALRRGDLKTAREAFQERNVRRPTTELYRLEARIREVEGDLDGAIAAAQRDLGVARIAQLPKRFASAVAYLARLLERRGRAWNALALLADADADPLLAGEWGLRIELVLNRLAAAERTSLESDDMQWQLGLRARQYLTRLDAGARETPALDRLLAAVLGADEPKYIRDAIRRVGLDPDAAPDLGVRLGRALAEWDRELVPLDGTEGRVARAVRLTDPRPSEDTWIAFVSGLGENARDVFGDAFWELNPPLAVLSALRVFYLYWGNNEIRRVGKSNSRVGIHFLEEVPLKFSRAEVRDLHSRLIASYPRAYELERLASLSGIAFDVIDRSQSVGGVARELLINASRQDRMGVLVQQVLNDVSGEQAQRVRNLIGRDWLERHGVGEPGTGLLEGDLRKRLVQAIIDNLPEPILGRRPVHTIGIGVKGEFVASGVARTYCIAGQFKGEPIPMSVRFSNGLEGLLHGGWGMAARFHLPDGTASDLIATTVGEFFVRNVNEFLAFAKVAKLEPYERRHWLLKLGDLLQLKVPPRNPYPNETRNVDAGALRYANRHRFAQLGVFQVGMIGAPESYARASYHAVHTFWVTAPDGVRRPVRFSWQPVVGVCNTDRTAVPRDKHLFEELKNHLRRWPASFMLMMTIGEAGDALDDPTRPWPARRIRVVMGTLQLTNVAEDQDADGERISFNPSRLAPGIEVSNDPILEARLGAYEVSREMRGGCPFKWR